MREVSQRLRLFCNQSRETLKQFGKIHLNAASAGQSPGVERSEGFPRTVEPRAIRLGQPLVGFGQPILHARGDFGGQDRHLFTTRQ